MGNPNRTQQILFAILVLNLMSTWLHYTDNALFLSQYPGPGWFTPIGILMTVFKMHSLIWLDAVSGLSLIAFLVWSAVIAQEWHSSETVD